VNPRRALFILIAVMIGSLLLFPALTASLADWWWFKEIGYQVVFTRELTTQFLLFLVGGGLTAGVIYLNLRFAQRGLVLNPIVFTLGQSVPKVNIAAVLRRITLPVALVIGFLGGIAATSAWRVVLQAFYRTAFGIVDPVFGRDIGYYVFSLPALSLLLGVLSTLAGFSLFFLLPIYFVRGDIKLNGRRVIFEPTAAMHLGLVAAVMLLLTALRLWLVDAPSLLYSTTGPLVGASYTDLHATLPAIYASAVLAVIAAIVVLIGPGGDRWRRRVSLRWVDTC
jgi:uncharacterized membrane protein (UPF0182 family)